MGKIVGAVFVRCSLFKGRWAISHCPVGIKIYLSRATPIGSIHGAAPPFISFHNHVLRMQYLQRRSRSSHCDIYACQVWQLLQRFLPRLFNIPLSWSPSLISCFVRACELTNCWITAFTYHTCQRTATQQIVVNSTSLFIISRADRDRRDKKAAVQSLSLVCH